MPEQFIILLLVALSWLPGWLLLTLFYRQRPPLTLATGFASLLLGIMAVGWFWLLLAEFGRFSLLNMGIGWLLLVMALLLLLLRGLRFASSKVDAGEESVEQQNRLPGWLESVVLLVWIATAVWLFFRPHEYIMGGADAGVYVSLGAQIARQGGFVYRDEMLAELPAELQAVVIRPLPKNPAAEGYLLPGFYVTDASAGEITPQFYPLHPVWYAAAFSLANSSLSGIQAELLLTGLWMLLGTLAIYLTAREMLGWETAVLVLAALTVVALQVWFARYPTTEALTQTLLWAGLWGVARWQGGRRPQQLWAFLGGAALGMVFLVRIDIIIILPVLAFFIFWLWLRGWQRDDWWFVTPLLLLVTHAFLHAVWQSRPYFYDHMGLALRVFWRNWLLLLVGLLAGLLFLWGARRVRGRFQGLKDYRKLALGLLIGAVLVFALYGWFIRPLLFDTILRSDAYSGGEIPITNHENWLRFAWYLSPVGVWLGVLGSCWLLWRVERKTWLVLAVGFLFSAVYLWNVRANPHHIYVMRRYAPVVLPFFLLAGGALVGAGIMSAGWTRGKIKVPAIVIRGAALLALLIWFVALAWNARGFISQVDHQGLARQLDAFNETLTLDSVLLFNDQAAVGLGDFWGTPLKYIYGHAVFALRAPDLLEDDQLAEMIELWQNNGRSVYWIGDPNWLKEFGFSYDSQEQILNSSRLEASYTQKPQAVVPASWALLVNKIE